MSEGDADVTPPVDVGLRRFQALIREMYGHKDHARGTDATFMWFVEEVGELASALRESPKEDLALEFADVLAWLATLANIADVDLAEAIRAKYGRGCPVCGNDVCTCGGEVKP